MTSNIGSQWILDPDLTAVEMNHRVMEATLGSTKSGIPSSTKARDLRVPVAPRGGRTTAADQRLSLRARPLGWRGFLGLGTPDQVTAEAQTQYRHR